MPRHARDRSERVAQHAIPPRNERREEVPPGVAIGTEPRSRRVDRALEQDGAAVVEGMRERRVRMDPAQPELGQADRVEEG